jgi:hypothetical protein
MIYIKSGSANVATTGIGSGRQDMDSAIVAIHETTNITNSINVTIGRILNYRSGSAIIATTGSGSEADSAMVAIRTITDYKSRQCHCDHRQATIGITRVDSVNETIDSRQCQYDHWYNNNYQADSAIVAIRENNKRKDRSIATGTTGVDF